MSRGFKTSRRGFLGAAAALGTMALTGCATNSTSGPRVAAGRRPGALAERGEFVIKNAHVLTMDPRLGEIAGGDIHVRNGAIVAVGRNLAAPAGAEIISADTMIALPGFIETHWHMWGAVARNMAGPTENTGYFFISRLLGQFFTPEDNARGVRLGLAEAISSGITTVTNWSHNLLAPEYADAEIKVHKEVGARARFAYGYSRRTPPDATLPLDDIARVQKQWFSDSNETLLTLGIAPRGPETNAIEIARQEWAFARARGLPITTHMGTSMERVMKRQGIRTLAKSGLLGPDVVLVHVTNNSPEDLKLLAETQTPVSMSPYTELRTGFGITPVGSFLRAGVPVSLSVDTTILCGNADMFAIMKAIQNIENGLQNSEFAISAQRVLEMATIDGARALGLDAHVGSLTPGKRADVILVRTTDVNMLPFTMPTNMIVQAAQPFNVDTVIVDGRFLKRDGKLTTIDMAQLARDSADTIERARKEASKEGSDKGINELFTR